MMTPQMDRMRSRRGDTQPRGASVDARLLRLIQDRFRWQRAQLCTDHNIECNCRMNPRWFNPHYQGMQHTFAAQQATDRGKTLIFVFDKDPSHRGDDKGGTPGRKPYPEGIQIADIRHRHRPHTASSSPPPLRNSPQSPKFRSSIRRIIIDSIHRVQSGRFFVLSMLALAAS